MTLHHQTDGLSLYTGDASVLAREVLVPKSVQTVVTSPPYFSLRSYDSPEQLGLERTPAEYLARLVDIFDAIRPALADDGTVWVVIGDTYVASPRARKGARGDGSADLPLKSMMMIPARFALAMQDAGWVLRNDIIWTKPNALPFSGTDRYANRHEHVFLFSKGARYKFDLDAVRVPHESIRSGISGTFGREKTGAMAAGRKYAQHRPGRRVGDGYHPNGKNPGDVWDVPVVAFPGAHFATFPPEIPKRCITPATSLGDTVLDPFSGAGTTGMVAREMGRAYVGFDTNSEYHDLALDTRLKDADWMGLLD